MRNYLFTSALAACIGFSMSTTADDDNARGDIPEVVRSSFTYQGNLEFNGEPANGEFHFRFSLFDTNETWLGTWYSYVGPVTVTDGLFTAEVLMGDDQAIAAQFWRDYGSSAKTMLIEVGEIKGAYTALSPRVELSASPHAVYSIRSSRANTADNLTFPYNDLVFGLDVGEAGFDIHAVPGIAARFSNSNTSSPAVDIHGPVIVEDVFISKVLYVGGDTNAIGVLSIADNFGMAGIVSNPGATAGVLGQVLSEGSSSSAGVYALHTLTGNSARLATGTYGGLFSGDIHVDFGEITKDFSNSPSPVGPIAYGFIDAGGTPINATANLSCVWNTGLLQYEISISGESLNALGDVVAVVTVVDGIEPRIATTITGNGKIAVTIWDLNSGNVRTSDNFQIVIYQAQPSGFARNSVPNGMDPEQYHRQSGRHLVPAPLNPPVEVPRAPSIFKD